MLKMRKMKKGFTLIEVIVVLVILAIIIALAVPSVMKYVDDANDVKDDIKISYLNKATEGYRVRMYGDGVWNGKDDLFKGVLESKEKQQLLLDTNWIEEYQTSIYNENDYFNWDIAKQRWVRKNSSGGGMNDEEKKENDTILGDIDKGNDRGDWEKNGTYKYGDIVEVNGVKYKCILTPKGNTIVSSLGPVYEGMGRESCWKEIKLEFDIKNIYETGDIVLYNNEYYKATGFDTSTDFMAYLNAVGASYSEGEIIGRLFKKVVWNNGVFIEAN